MAISPTPAECFPDGVQPHKPTIRSWMSQVETLAGVSASGSVGGALIYQTKADLLADATDRVQYQRADVINDPVAANNGIYQNQSATSINNFVKIGESTDEIWSVQMFGPVIVDIGSRVVRYPDMVLVANGRAYKAISAVDYGLPFLSAGIPATLTQSDFHYIDVSLIGGGTSPIKSTGNATAPAPNGNIVPLGSIYNGYYNSYCGARVVGDQQPGGTKPNSYGYSAAIDRAPPEAVYSGTIDNITDSVLVSLGLTRGIRDVAGKSPFWRANISAPQRGQVIFVRIFIQTAEANYFGTPQALTAFDGSIGYETFALKLETKFSANAAVYSGSIRMTVPPINRHLCLIVGSTYTAAGHEAADLRITGLQIGSDDTDSWWVTRSDLYNRDSGTQTLANIDMAMAPAPIDIRAAPQLFLTAGRKATIYWEQVLYDKTLGGGMAGWFSSLNGNTGAVYSRYGWPQLEIDPDLCGPSGVLGGKPLRGEGRDFSFEIPFTIYKAPASGSGSPKVLCIGDSLTHGVPSNLLKKLTTLMGLTVNFIGTMDDTVSTFPDLSTAQANTEGRSGIRYADYTYEQTDVLTPVAVGGEAAYLALADTAKVAKNPFLKTPGVDPSDGSNDSTRAGLTYNGQIFDPYFYINRFGFSAPNIVFIGLGTNDTNKTWIDHGIDVFYSQWRRQYPNAHLVFWITGLPRGVTADAYHISRRRDNIINNSLAYIATKKSGGDNRVWWLNVNLFMHPNTGWLGQVVQTTDTVTGVKKYLQNSDVLHCVDQGVPQWQQANAIASFIGAYAAGLIPA